MQRGRFGDDRLRRGLLITGCRRDEQVLPDAAGEQPDILLYLGGFISDKIGDDIELMVDANQGFTAAEAIRRARHFEPLDLAWFEELHRHGPLSSTYLRAFSPGNDRADLRRLTDLYHEADTPHGSAYLERPPQQTRTLDPRANDLVYAIVLDWPGDLRRQCELAILQRYHATLVERGVRDYPWQQLWDDYRLCAAMGVYVAVEYCRGGVNERWIDSWLTMLQGSLTACDDLDCRGLW